MINCLVAFFILFFSLSFAVIANEEEEEKPELKKFLVIQPFKTPLLEYLDVDRINKIILRATTKQSQFELAMTNLEDFEKSKVSVYQVQVHLEKDPIKKTFSAKALLVDLKNKKLINKIEELNIPSIELIRRIEDMLAKLFESYREVGKQRFKPPRNSNRKDQITAAIENKAMINFRDRIMNLKTNVQNKFDEINEEKTAKEDIKAEDGLASRKKDQDDQNNPQNTSQLDLADAGILNPEKPSVSKPAKVKQAVSVGYRSDSISAKENIDTNTSATYLDVSYRYKRNLFYIPAHYLNLGLRFGKLNGEYDQKLNNRLEYGIAYEYFFSNLPLSIETGLSNHTLSFINLPVVGEGLQSGNLDIRSWIISLNSKGHIWRFPIEISAYYSQAISASADYATIQNEGGISGSKIVFNLLCENVYRKFNLGLQYNMQGYQSSEGTLKLNSTGLEVYASMYF